MLKGRLGLDSAKVPYADRAGLLYLARGALTSRDGTLAFVQGATSVRLGLDLRGGTSVTLQPRIAPGESGKVTNEAIDQAVSITRRPVSPGTEITI